MTQTELDKFKNIVTELKNEDSNKEDVNVKQVLRQIRDVLIAQGYNLNKK